MSMGDRNCHDMTSIFQDRLAIALIMGGLAVRVVCSIFLPLAFDEAYYGVFSRNLAWGYFDHPPIVAVTAGLGPWLTGSHSPLSLRAGALVAFLFSSILIYRLTSLLADRRAARIALFMLHATPFFFIGMGAIVLPDNALGLFWLLFLFCLAKIQETGRDKWLLPAGVSLGLALMSKYHAVLLSLGFLYCLVRYREWRGLLRSPYLYGGLGIAVICFLPNVYWNSQHDWVSYLYQLGRNASRLELSCRMFLRGILIQAAYLLPWNLCLFVCAMFLTFRKKFDRARWLLPFAVLPVGVFTLIGATIPIMPHWPMPGYLAAIILAAIWMAGWQRLRLNRFLKTSGITTLVIALVIPLQAATGVLPINKKVDMTLDGQGWQEVVGHLEAQGLLKGGNSFLFTHRWFTGGELAYAAGSRFTTTVLNSSDSHCFALWTDMNEIEGKDGIFVTTERFPADPEELYEDCFGEYIRLQDITTSRYGRPAQVFHLWLCRTLMKAHPCTLACPTCTTTVDFKKSSWPGVISSARGLSGAEPWGTWSSSDAVTLEFSEPLPEKLAVHLVARAFGPNVGKEFVAHVGDSAFRFTLAASRRRRVLEFSNPKGSKILKIDVPSPCSPKELGLSDDDRRLGIAFTELRIEPL